jgi:ethanolaminephosphotransferase
MTQSKMYAKPSPKLAMNVSTSWLLLAVVNLLLPLGILIFAKGFFPYKPFLPGLAEFGNDVRVPKVFDKVVFMVVDALRRCACYSGGRAGPATVC